MSELALPSPTVAELPRGERRLSDELLARLVGRGSARAFAVLYERHHQALYRYCRSIVRDEHDAQDALQSTMTQAYAALSAKERDLSVRAWLFRIAHNESISLLRKRGRDSQLSNGQDPVDTDLEAAVETRARLAALVADLRELPERQRAALIMRELSGLRLGEIAGALSISPAGAKQALFEARNSLREIAEGREMLCEGVREALSARDGRVLRGRRIRAHLRACEDCRAFQTAIGARESDLRLLAPALPGPVAVTILGGLLAGSGSHFTGGGGAAASGSSLASAGGSTGSSLLGHIGGSLIAKGIAGAAIVAAATAGTARLATVGASRHAVTGSQLRTGAAQPGASTGSSLAGGDATVSRAQPGGESNSASAGRGASILGAASLSTTLGKGHAHAGVKAGEPAVPRAQAGHGHGRPAQHGVGAAAGNGGASGRSGEARGRHSSRRPAESGKQHQSRSPSPPARHEHSHAATGSQGASHAPAAGAGAGEMGNRPSQSETARGSGAAQADGVQAPAAESSAARREASPGF
jgi:RNA polymerase sigma factor (sigma-70 family)